MKNFILEDISDKELDEKINGSLHSLRGGDRFEGNAVPCYIAEKSRKNIIYTSDITQAISKRTFSTARLALIIAFMAMAFSIVDYFGDKSWRQDQLLELKEIQKNTKITFE